MYKWNCGYHYGLKLLIFGALILINEFWLAWSWGLFLGLVFLIVGIIKLLIHGKCSCGMENRMVDMPKKSRKR